MAEEEGVVLEEDVVGVAAARVAVVDEQTNMHTHTHSAIIVLYTLVLFMNKLLIFFPLLLCIEGIISLIRTIFYNIVSHTHYMLERVERKISDKKFTQLVTCVF